MVENERRKEAGGESEGRERERREPRTGSGGEREKGMGMGEEEEEAAEEGWSAQWTVRARVSREREPEWGAERERRAAPWREAVAKSRKRERAAWVTRGASASA